MENNIYRLQDGDKEFILIATAHVSAKSVEEVAETIDQEKPDSVCIELCPSRYDSINNKEKWKNMDIFKIIKEKRAILLLVNLILSSYQKRIAAQLGIQAGQEMMQGITSAKKHGARLVLADRDIQITFKRIWYNLTLRGKFKIMLAIVFSLFSKEKFEEEELEKMKSEDMLNMALKELADSFPDLKTPLVDERDTYLAQKIKTAPGNKVVAVLGAAHVPGIKKRIFEDHDLAELEFIPAKKSKIKIVAWGIGIFILTLIAYTFSLDSSAGMDQVVSWILWNGSFSALGALAAFAHPVSILVAFLVAPISSLSPLLAAGWFAGLTEAYMRKPQVKDFEMLAEDISVPKKFWQNKVTRILLVIAFANLGSSLGTFIGGADVIKTFFQTLGW